MRTESRPVSRFAGRRIHFIGIGGCGMSGLARMLLDCGAIISGSDPKPNPQIDELAGRGVRISRQQDGSLLSANVDLVVRTAAVPDVNPEFQMTQQLGLHHMKYAQLLGQVMRERLGVAISGTHGKSTTTAMTSYALLQCGADPSFVIGGTVPQLGGSSRSGRGESFVVEACEFDRSFHNYHPAITIITNIEEDHLDCYPGGIGEIIESFRVFAERTHVDGRIFANGQDDHVRQCLAGTDRKIEAFGVESEPTLPWSTRSLGQENGCYRGQLHHDGVPVALIRLAIPGIHNLYNATAAIAACAACGVDPQRAAEALADFVGVDRRMSELGKFGGAIILDDYGHHPTEIRTTLRALREKYHPSRLICVFQPHQYSRTRCLLNDFACSFTDADLTILPDIYAARDTDEDRRSVATSDLVAGISRNGRTAIHIATLRDIVEHLKHVARDGDLIVTMGAGNVCDVGRKLIEA